MIQYARPIAARRVSGIGCAGRQQFRRQMMVLDHRGHEAEAGENRDVFLRRVGVVLAADQVAEHPRLPPPSSPCR